MYFSHSSVCLPPHLKLGACALALDEVASPDLVILIHWCLSGLRHPIQYQFGQCSQVYLYLGLPLQIVHRESCQFGILRCAALLKSIIA